MNSVGRRYGVAQDSHNLYMLLEFIIGGELFTHLRKAGKFANEHGRFYAAQIALGLQYLHEECGPVCNPLHGAVHSHADHHRRNLLSRQF